MPTPFYHLGVAGELIHHPDLPSAARELIQSQPAAFLLGNTAPDVQTVTGQSRAETHFFDLPIPPASPPAWDRMLARYPALARAFDLPEAQSAFLAGYLCHLQADWLWVLQIFSPVFGPWAGWDSFRRRLYLHNVLRAYLDRQIVPDLPGNMGAVLDQASPRRWLPFVSDDGLRLWRDQLSEQLYPGAAVQTVEVFAARQGIPPEVYYQLLDSEERMDREVFNRLSRTALSEYRERLVQANLHLLQAYFGARQSRLQ